MKKRCLLVFLLVLCGVVVAQKDEVYKLDKEGYALLEQGKYQEAIEVYSRLIRLDPSLAIEYYNRALCNYHLKRYEAAIPDLEKALSLDKGIWQAHGILGLIHYNKGEKEQSLVHYSNVWDERTNINNPIFQDAQLLFREKKYDEALVWYKQCIKHNITLFYANYQAGLISYNKHLISEARDYFKAATTFTNEKDVHIAFLALGRVEAVRKRYNEAIPALDFYIKNGEPNAEAYYLRGMCQLKNRSNNFQFNAMSDFQKALELKPEAWDNAYGMACVDIETKRFSKALTRLDTLIKEVPRSPELYVALGRAYAGLMRYSDALDAFGKAKQVKPNYPDTYLEEGKLYLNQHMPEQALEQLETALRLDKTNPEIRLYHARTISLLGRVEEAKQTLNDLLADKYEPFSRYNRGMANYFMALICHEQNDEEGAKMHYHAASLIVEEAGLWYGNLLLERGDVENARTAYWIGDFASIYGNAELNCRLGNLELSKKKYKDALDAFRKGFVNHPEVAEVWFGAGMAYVGLKDRVAAMEALTKAIELDQSNPEAYFQRALLYLKDKKTEEARRDLQAASDLGHAEAKKRLDKLK